jgi:hypothetical protein
VFGPRNGGLLATQNAFTGDQIRGFGYTHAGEEDTMFHFMASIAFIKNVTFGLPFVEDNLGGFESTLPTDRAACFDQQLGLLNAQFLSLLAPEETLNELRAHLTVSADPTSTPEALATATAAVAAFVGGLPADNPGAILQKAQATQLSLPLLECVGLPDAATLESLGCFNLGFFPPPTCVELFASVRGCAQWGSTLEQLFGSDPQVCEPDGLRQRREVEDFLFAYDSNLKPIVGQQVTLRRNLDSDDSPRVDLLLAQADAGHCDVVAHSGRRGAVYEGGAFLTDTGQTRSLAQLRRTSRALTLTAVPPGEGRRSGIDRDRNGRLDGL